MKFLSIGCIVLLSLALTGCDKNDNFLVKEVAFSVITTGFNASSNELDFMIDTATLYPIPRGNSFKRTDKYTFADGQDSVKLVIIEKGKGVPIYERQVKRGEYSVTIQLIYVNGKLITKPVAPADNPAGFRLVSYLFLTQISHYAGDIDAVYYKKYETVKNGQVVIEKLEELARMTFKPYEFSGFLKAPSFPGGRTEINGQVYFLNPVVQFYKAGTDIPYYEGTGVSLNQYASLPLPFSTKPEILAISESGTPGGTYINTYQQVKF